ncbi:MAG: Tol-Pal system beta propeller repeat protein TolB [Coxiellaceae bacterium]|nr:Tol-Pal system beta propeller repeat protein TolB [Coxiellaceae bacterium]
MSCLLMLFACLPFTAMAALNLELTQGIGKAIPIAVANFSGGAVQGPGDQTVEQVVTNDLTHSGQFRVLNPVIDNVTAQLQKPNYNQWRQLGVNDVLLGSVTSRFGNRYQVKVKLVDVYSKAVLVNQSFTVSKDDLRQVAHRISDMVYQKLTGTRGVFSTKLAYVLVKHEAGKPSRYALEVSDADGFNPRPLLVSYMPIMSPAWTPDGKQIAYVSFEGHRAAVYLQTLATGKRSKISALPGINGAPAFSPNGDMVALVLTRSGNPKLYTLDLRSQQLKELTRGRSIDTEPNWAPDGRSILFTSNRGGSPQIYRYELASGSINRVTYDGNYNARARFLPDEKSIVMLHRKSGLFGIAKQDLSSGRVNVLTRANSDESPSLAPNGKMVIYATSYGGRGVLAMVSTDGRIKLRLPAREGNVQEPAWSPYLQG